ncbi:HAMP domain-containing sensor histidine kinase [Methanolapillus ohkumae]|uniref:Histidine kinase/HSP90-like ATPase domain-containing protein n=1 Tax=Methanolapillus ohkumae TaxID=3028298 RepID=A0AA96V5U9_9EURY|nr:hypothetical protein MsAm2_08760 [Methanosarcinaceae archaeon Am2]
MPENSRTSNCEPSSLISETAQASPPDYSETGIEVFGLLRHDLQNYFSVILMSLELYHMKNDEKYLDKIAEASYKSLDYLSRFKEVERYLYREIVPVPCSLLNAIEKAVFKFPNLSFSIEGEDGVVLGDRNLPAIFEFLFSNVSLYGNVNEPVQISISQSVDGSIRKCRIDVTNYGDPIPESIHSSLFYPGVKGPESTGFGLGLYLSKVMALRYGGDLVLKETTPEKTTLSLILPFSDDDSGI